MTAMNGGALAGRVARKAIARSDASVRVLREYESEWKSTVGKRLKRMYKAKEFIINRSDEDLNRIAHALRGVQSYEMNPQRIAARLLKKDPGLLLMVHHLL